MPIIPISQLSDENTEQSKSSVIPIDQLPEDNAKEPTDQELLKEYRPSLSGQISNQGEQQDSEQKNKSDSNLLLGPLGMIPGVTSGLERGVVQGSQGIIQLGVNAYELGSKVLNKNPSDAPRKFLEESKQGLDELIPPHQSFISKVAEGVGQLPAMIAMFENPIVAGAGKMAELNALRPAIANAFKTAQVAGEAGDVASKTAALTQAGEMLSKFKIGIKQIQNAKTIAQVSLATGIGAINSQEGGIGAMIGGGAVSAGQLYALGAAQRMGLIGKVVTGASAMAVPELFNESNDENEVLAKATLGASFALFSKSTPRQVGDVLETAGRLAKNPKQFYSTVMESFHKDPIQAKARDLSEQESMVKNNVAKADDLYKAKLAYHEGVARAETADQKVMLENAKFKIGEEYLNKQEMLDREISNETLRRQNELDSLLERMPSMAFNTEQSIKELLISQRKQATGSYGPLIDAASERVGPISQETAVSMLTKTISDAVNSGTVYRDAEGNLKSDFSMEKSAIDLLSRYTSQANGLDKFFKKNPTLNNPNFIQTLESGRFGDKSLQQEYLSAKSSSGSEIPFKQFYAETRRIIEKNPEHPISTSLRKQIGNHISMVDPEFSKVQAEYAAYAQAREELEAIHKPFKKADTKSGEAAIRRIYEGKLEPGSGEERLNRILTEGWKDNKYIKVKGQQGLFDAYNHASEQAKKFEDYVKSTKDKQFGPYAERYAQITRSKIDELMKLEENGAIDHSIVQQKLYDAHVEILHEKALAENDFMEKMKVIKSTGRHLGRLESAMKRQEALAGTAINFLRAFGAWHFAWGARATLSARRAMKIGSKYTMKYK